MRISWAGKFYRETKCASALAFISLVCKPSLLSPRSLSPAIKTAKQRGSVPFKCLRNTRAQNTTRIPPLQDCVPVPFCRRTYAAPIASFKGVIGYNRTILKSRYSIRRSCFSAKASTSVCGAPTSDGVSQQLWQDAQRQVSRSLFHPFVLGIANGNLPIEAFKHYISQDAYFLEAFAKGYALAAEQSDGHPPHVRDALIELEKGAYEELELHRSYAEKWGVDLSDCEPSPATLAYTSFVLGIAESRQGVPMVLAAMAPCMRLYSYLGSQLREAVPEATSPNNPYSEWVHTYGSPDFEALAKQLEDILDELAAGEPYEPLCAAYRRAMDLEAQFFGAQPGLEEARPLGVGLFVTDFDDTLTTKDTTPIIIEAAFSAAERAAPEERRGDLRREWEQRLREVLQLISEEQKALRERLQSKGPTAGFDPERLSEVLAELSDFDRRMNEAAFSSGIIKGVSEGDVTEAARNIELRDGSREFLRRAQRLRVPTHVVSVSWAQDVIRAALSPLEPGVEANRLSLGGDGLCDGAISGEMQTAEDKRGALRRLLGGERRGPTVYVGDSATDLGALLDADVGIVVGDNGMLRPAAEAASASVRPLVALAAAARGGASPRAAGTVYRANSWWDIAQLLLGDDDPASEGRREAPRVPRALTIAGSDSGGGAGIQADLKSFMARGTFGMSAVTALTAQNTQGVQAVHPVDVEFIEKQIQCVLQDIGADAVKTGMLPNKEVVEAVANQLRINKVQNVVVDPVLISTSGHALGDDTAARAMLAELFPLATIVTPNLPEASALLGLDKTIDSVAGMKDAALKLYGHGPKYVLVKGGHLKSEGESIDILYDGTTFHEIRASFVKTENLHGTGCTLAASIAAELAKGLDAVVAVRNAKAYLVEALRKSCSLSIGVGPQRPFNHGFEICDWSSSFRKRDVDYRSIALKDVKLLLVTIPANISVRCG
mmetsp:Transcript_30506/g.72639  ORF Transcript_30506/g.72639 Transcript_30506/m.72639 type:complete len:947 (+) Transcript_30506:59-2899(+)